MWTGVYLSGLVNIYIFFLILMYHGLQYVGLLRALYTSCYCHIIIGMCVFHGHQCDICHRRAYSQGFAKSNNRQNVDLAYKPLFLGAHSHVITTCYY